MSAISGAEMNQQIVTAKRFPRNMDEFRATIMDEATRDEEVAGDCMYSLPRGDNQIEGASARFAELAAALYGNCRYGFRIVEEGERTVTAQGMFFDLEKNVQVQADVKRRITDKQGRRYKDDMIVVTGQAAGSIAMRNAILKGIPKIYWSAAYNQARLTTMGESKPLETVRKDAFSYLLRFGVDGEMIRRKLGVRTNKDITRDHILTLRGWATSLKDGEMTTETLFESEPSSHASAKTVADFANGSDKPEWPQESDGILYAVNELPWNPDFHSTSKSCNANGTWRLRRGYDQLALNAWEESILANAAKREPENEPEGEEAPTVESGTNMDRSFFEQAIATAKTSEEIDRIMADIGNADLPPADKPILRQFAEAMREELTL